MKPLRFPDLSIAQSIVVSTMIIVTVVLGVTGMTFYTTFAFRTDALVETQSREINKQIVLNYESYINSLIETANYIQSSSLNLDLAESGERLRDIYLFNTESKKDVMSIFLFDAGGRRLLGDRGKDSLPLEVSRELWFRNALRDEEIFHFSRPHLLTQSSDGEEVISVSKVVDYLEAGVQRKGVLLLELNFQAIRDLAKQTNLGPGGHILILNDDDSLIYSSLREDELSSESLRLARSRHLGGFNALIGGVGMYGNINTLSRTRWRIVSVTNINDIVEARQRMLYVLFIIMGAALLITTPVAVFISRRITSPLNQLKKSMLRIEEGDFFTRVEGVTGQKEIVLVARAFNDMIDRIRLLMDRVVSEQREKRKNELVALQNQINPHFLYNTLDSIVWLAENERNEDVITTVVALARFFRISISKGKNFISVRDEINHIRNYLTIQTIRYIGKFEYKLEIDKAIYDLKVMKLILQPLVENAIYHGVGEEDEVITIRGYKEENFLVFEVENTGYGIPEDKIARIYRVLEGEEEGQSVGLKNVYQRLKLYYGEEARMIMSSELDEMTNVKLRIPVGHQEGGR